MADNDQPATPTQPPAAPGATHEASSRPLVTPGPRRFILPAICGLLALPAFAYAFLDTVTYGKTDDIGPLPSEQVAVMGGTFCLILCGITLLLAVLPDPSPTERPARSPQAQPRTHRLQDSDLQQISRVVDRSGNMSEKEVLDALGQSVTRINHDLEVATATALAERARGSAALAERDRLQERLQGLLDGSSDEGKSLHDRIASKVHRELLADTSASEATQRLIDTLKASQQHAIREAAVARRALDEMRSEDEARVAKAISDYRARCAAALHAAEAALRDERPEDDEAIRAAMQRARRTLLSLDPNAQGPEPDDSTVARVLARRSNPISTPSDSEAPGLHHPALVTDEQSRTTHAPGNDIPQRPEVPVDHPGEPQRAAIPLDNSTPPGPAASKHGKKKPPKASKAARATNPKPKSRRRD